MYIRNSFRTSILGLVAVGLPVTLAAPAGGYPIDCAILLCLAGGFPASAECSAAHAEMLRRITPWPIDPPVQFWRCPMGGTVGLSRNFGEPSPEIRKYRDGIEVWQLSKRTTNSSGGRESEAYTVRSFYDAAGTFQSGSVDPLTVPPWIDDKVRIHTGTTLVSDFGSFDAILMRHHNNQGEPSYEWIRY
ncbi:hypothetical protein [Roseovarius indicus]|uniref:hypothetical protein n=1 Tax=Roseovarius indicus TaxID=540747 RepID=UPI004059DEB0